MRAFLARAAVVVLVLAIVAPAFLPSPSPAPSGGVRDREAGGRRAALALLDALGLPARAWAGPPAALEDEDGLLWTSVPPAAFDLEREDPGAPVGAIHDPARYLEFCERGGALVAVGTDGGRFLSRALGLRPFADLERDRDGARAVTAASWIGGETLALDLVAVRPLQPRALERGLDPLLELEDGALFAVEMPIGLGRAVWLATDAFLTNDRIARADHGLVLVRLVEVLAEGRPVLFDEYARGAWRPPGLLALARGPRLALLSGHLLALAVLFAWSAVWVRGFPREPLEWRTRSPLVRARASAGLLLRARRPGLLGRDLVEHGLRSLAGRARLAPREGDDAGVLLTRLLAHAGRSEEEHEWRAALLDTTPRDGAGLERMGQRLVELERVVLERTHVDRDEERVSA